MTLPDQVDRLTESISALGWLAERGAVTGIAAVIAERRRLIEENIPLAGADLAGVAAAELAAGSTVLAAAFLAADLDREKAVT
jgi:hypothetical protein